MHSAKAGRTGNSTLFASPTEQKFRESVSDIQRLENLKSFAVTALDAHFGQGSPGRVGDITSFSMEPHDVATLIHAAGIPLVGHAVKLTWQPCIPDGESWSISSRRGLMKSALAWEYPMRLMPQRKDPPFTETQFEFGGVGELLSKRIFIRDTNEVRENAFVLRAPDDKRAITTEEALGAVSIVLFAFEPLRLALTADADVKVLKRLAKIRGSASKLSQNLKHPEARIVYERGWEAIAAQAEVLATDVRNVENALKDKEVKEARISIMAPLSACFQILFGRRPTADNTLSNSPFIKFAHAFLEIVGCPRKRVTVGSDFRAWQRAQLSKRE